MRLAPRDVEQVPQRLRAGRSGRLCVEIRRANLQFRPVLLIETGVVPHWSVPLRDVHAWTYGDPETSPAVVAGRLAVAGEVPGADIVGDGDEESAH